MNMAQRFSFTINSKVLFMSKKLTLSSLLCLSIMLAAFSLAGCSGEEKKAAAPSGPVPMKVMKAATKDMPYWGEFVGQISAVESVDVRARVAGFLLEKNFQEGREVKKGDLLFVIDPQTFQEDLKQAQSSLEYNQALLAKAEKDKSRYEKLLDEGVVSRTEFEGYQTDFSTYQAKVRENKAQVQNARIQLGYTKVYSPIDGIIGRVQVDIGNLVGQGENTLLATVSTVDPVYVTFSIPESDYIRARRNPEVQETREKDIELILADGSRYGINGSFSMIDRAVDPQTGTLGIRVSFPNPEGLLRPGQYGKVRVLIENHSEAVVVPTRGVVDVQGMKSIYVVGEDGKVVSKPIKLGFEVDDLVVVNEGLKAGEIVIIDGIRRVRPGMEIKPIVVPMGKSEGTPASTGDAPKADTEQKEG